jgi:hypothetical protein
MRALRLAILLTLLTGTAAGQGPSTNSTAPDVAVLKVSWRRVEPINPKLNDTRVIANVDSGARTAVNTARTNEANSIRQSGGNPPPPALLAYPATPDQPPVMRPWSGFIYEFTVRNTGTKTIRQVVFDYSFTDPRTQQTVGRRQYKSKVKIHPGLTGKLVVRTSSPPRGTIDARQGANQPDQTPDQVVIQKIKYADGSVWQRNAN